MRKTPLVENEYYHIYNRGVDKRSVFQAKEDLLRFLNCMEIFNTVDTIGGIYQSTLIKNASFRGSTSKLVKFVAYCLNQNHYHFILESLVENGIQKFMHRLSTGYTYYFNNKYERSGSLFQGRYKSIHVENDAYLLHLSVYVNLNNRVHLNLNESWLEDLNFSSFLEYIGSGLAGKYCDSSIVLDQFNSVEEYIKYAEDTLPYILQKKESDKILKKLVLE